MLNLRVYGMKCVYNYCLHNDRIQDFIYLELLELHEHFVVQPIIWIWCLQNPGSEFSRRHIRLGMVAAILREVYILSQPTLICMKVIKGC